MGWVVSPEGPQRSEGGAERPQEQFTGGGDGKGMDTRPAAAAAASGCASTGALALGAVERSRLRRGGARPQQPVIPGSFTRTNTYTPNRTNTYIRSRIDRTNTYTTYK